MGFMSLMTSASLISKKKDFSGTITGATPAATPSSIVVTVSGTYSSFNWKNNITNTTGTVSTPNGGSFSDSPLTSSTNYTYTITPVSANGISGKTFTSGTFTTSAPVQSGYRYYKFTPTKFKGAGNSVQLSELIVAVDGTRVNYTGAVASNPGGNNPGSERPAQAIDNNFGSKWLDFNKLSLIIDFGTQITANNYTFATANDSTDRDPVSWIFYGSNDNSTWTTLNTQTDYPTTNNRQTQLPWFSF